MAKNCSLELRSEQVIESAALSDYSSDACWLFPLLILQYQSCLNRMGSYVLKIPPKKVTKMPIILSKLMLVMCSTFSWMKVFGAKMFLFFNGRNICWIGSKNLGDAGSTGTMCSYPVPPKTATSCWLAWWTSKVIWVTMNGVLYVCSTISTSKCCLSSIWSTLNILVSQSTKLTTSSYSGS